MRLVTYQPNNTSELKTGIQINKDEIIDIVTEARARDSALKVDTMLDIIQGGDAVMGLLRAIEAAPTSAPILLNHALLKAPIPRTTKNVFAVGALEKNTGHVGNSRLSSSVFPPSAK